MFGRKQPDIHDPNRIGRYGVGFMHAAMGLGKDALVITQTANSRSIAFLSRTLNDGKDSTEIPIVTYARNGHLMGYLLQLTRYSFSKETSGSQIRPDHEWAQCNMCRQWRMLDPKFDSKTLLRMCDMPEEEIQEPRVEVVSSPKVSRVRQHRSGPERLCDIPEEEIQGPRAIAESSESIRDTCNEISPQQKTRQYKRKPKNAAGDIPEEDIQGPRVIVESSQQTGDTCKGKPAPKKKRQYQSKPKDAAGTVQQLRTLPKRQCRKD
ncbi:hypothetical protein Tco_0143844 [Tanacetum coccineum]